MRLCAWEDLPPEMRSEAVRPYYERLRRRGVSLILKRTFDIAAALLLIVLLAPVFLVLSALIRLDSPGGVWFRQVRVTQNGRRFRIFKFRTMVAGAEGMGAQVTVQGDARVTGIGRLLRRCRLDELPQLFNILSGDMSFVGTRPEVPKYVAAYTGEMWATLLLPAGVTSLASIAFKDEEGLIGPSQDADEVYIGSVLPRKMRYNLEALRGFSLRGELAVMARTVFAVARRDAAPGVEDRPAASGKNCVSDSQER